MTDKDRPEDADGFWPIGNDAEALEHALRLRIYAPTDELKEKAALLAEEIADGLNLDTVEKVKDRIEKSEAHAKRFDELATVANSLSNYDLSLLLGMVANRIAVFNSDTGIMHDLDEIPAVLNGAGVQLNLEPGAR